MPFMPWQQHVADVALEVDPATGLLAYRSVMLTVPRQAGKTTLLLAAIVLRCQEFGARQRCVYTAQDKNSAREKFEEEHLEILRAAPGLIEGKHFDARLSNGSERILFKPTRSMYKVSATNPSSGHGRALDLAMIDEAFEHKDARVDAGFRVPMITRLQPQMWIVSTAGTWESAYYLTKQAAGREAVEAGRDRGVAYFEWSADEDADLWDPDVWRRTHPALGHTIDEEVLRGEIEALIAGPGGEAEARRAFLNVTTGQADVEHGLDLDQWGAQMDDSSSIEGRMVLGVDVAWDRSEAAVATAGGRPDGSAHVEVIETGVGSGWVVERLRRLTAAHDVAGVAIDPGSPAGSLIADVEAEGIEVIKMTARDHAQACGALHDRLESREVWHLGQPVLDDAVLASRRRPLGDAWAWDRKGAGVFPLVAATLALGAFLALDPRQAPMVSVYDDLEGFGEY